MATDTIAPQPSGGRLATPAQAAQARAQANWMRAEHLQSVHNGLMSIFDIIDAARYPQHTPLLRLRLNQLLLSQPGWGTARTRGTLRRMLLLLGRPEEPTGQLTMAWLLDPRAKGARTAALLDALHGPYTAAPWAGFPYRPAPANTKPPPTSPD